MTSEEYPHWRTALFGNGHVANAWCAIKYGFWHLIYVIIAAGLLLIRGIVFLLEAPPWDRLNHVGERLSERSKSLADNKGLRNGVKLVLTGFFLIFLVAWVIGVAIWAFLNPILFLAWVGAIALVALGIVGLVYFVEELWPDLRDDYVYPALFNLAALILSPFIVTGSETKRVVTTVKKKADSKKNQPVYRRVYGHCPVKMDIEPKWFNRFVDK